MALGGLLAVSDRRYRIKLREQAPQPILAPEQPTTANIPAATSTTGVA
jgi:hypothetical protein